MELRLITDPNFKEKFPVGSFIQVIKSKYDKTFGNVSYISDLMGNNGEWVLDVSLLWFTEKIEGGI